MTVDTEITDQVLAIAKDVFTAMIDGEPGGVDLWTEALPYMNDPLHAWVDMAGALPARAALSAEHTTCLDLARALMSMGADEEVSTADLIDAFGEVANVVGGNIKALIPDPGTLSLPQVGKDLPIAALPDHQVILRWWGSPILISLWTLEDTEGDRP